MEHPGARISTDLGSSERRCISSCSRWGPRPGAGDSELRNSHCLPLRNMQHPPLCLFVVYLLLEAIIPPSIGYSSFYPSAHPSTHLLSHLFIHSLIHPSIHPSIDPSIHLFFHLSIHHLSIHHSIHPPIIHPLIHPEKELTHLNSLPCHSKCLSHRILIAPLPRKFYHLHFIDRETKALRCFKLLAESQENEELVIHS